MGRCHMHTDADLLRRYVEERSQAAFTELVQRHLRLVYAAALHRVGHDTHLAEDVAQTVFTDLARKAGSLRNRATLSGWLYVSTHHAAAAIVRGEQRRKVRETEAQTMQMLSSSPDAGPDWRTLRPILDEAVVQLHDDEREAIALRFFEKRSFSDVGVALRLTEDTARKRVERALEKLRVTLARRGVTSSTAMLTLALGELGTGAAPPDLAGRIAGRALAQSAITHGGATAIGLSALAGALILAGVAVVINQAHANRQLASELEKLAVDPRALTAVRTENLALKRGVAEADALRAAAADLPALRAKLAPSPAASAQQAPVRATVTVQADGTIRWGKEPVSLNEFISRLRALPQTAPDAEAKVGIRGLSEFAPLAFVIAEARKAQLKHVVVESNATPDPKLGFSWFDTR